MPKLMSFIFVLTFFSIQLKAELKPEMQEFFRLVKSMQSYLANKSEFMDEKNSESIKKNLSDFVVATQKLKKDKMAQNEDMKFRAEQISDGLKEAEEAFKSGFKDYSYWALKSSFNNCYSCHTQKSLPETNYKFQNDVEGTFANAEYLFLVRNYNEALPIYKKLIIEYPKNKVANDILDQAVEKILFYLVRVQRDDQKSTETFNSFLKNKNLPSANKSELKDWINYLSLKKYRIVEELMIQDQKRLEEWIAERETIAKHYAYAGHRVIVDLETSYHLFKLLESQPSKELRPWLLFWLADIEKNYRNNMFDTTPELYLKECIVKFSKNPAAKKCYGLFKEMKIDSFTGTRGTEIPKSVQDQLKSYENLVK